MDDVAKEWHRAQIIGRLDGLELGPDAATTKISDLMRWAMVAKADRAVVRHWRSEWGISPEAARHVRVIMKRDDNLMKRLALFARLDSLMPDAARRPAALLAAEAGVTTGAVYEWLRWRKQGRPKGQSPQNVSMTPPGTLTMAKPSCRRHAKARPPPAGAWGATERTWRLNEDWRNMAVVPCDVCGKAIKLTRSEDYRLHHGTQTTFYCSQRHKKKGLTRRCG